MINDSIYPVPRLLAKTFYNLPKITSLRVSRLVESRKKLRHVELNEVNLVFVHHNHVIVMPAHYKQHCRTTAVSEAHAATPVCKYYSFARTISTHTITYAHTNTNTQTHTNTCTHTLTHSHTHTLTNTHVRTYTRKHTTCIYCA